MFAFVSTVSTLGDKFPNGVMLFRTEGEAYELAAELLVTHDSRVDKHQDETTWSINDPGSAPMVYYSAAAMVSDWQDYLFPTEYFHVYRVLDLPQTVRELFLDRDYESFVRSIERMNQMYRLQVATVPTLKFIDNKSDGSQVTVDAVTRLECFKKTLLDEISEIELIMSTAKILNYQNTRDPKREIAIECLIATADLLADIIVYCVSEMRKFGLPPAAIMAIVMQSNMSKLQPDGSAKYDDNGKFLKGPNYFPPEPKIKELITELLEGHDPL